ncbi:hypothetical protein [Nonomuraea typhae]|uniref:hypothetical protein n=1 Tax=Nonomuraea typhae TaxID=2603600 RepID=UPI0012F75E37|nr:hypothetical protein [Nonomuraea typhae]
MIVAMPSVAGQARRVYGTGGTVPLQTKVPQWLRDRYHAAAKRRSVSLSRYLEELSQLDHLLELREQLQKLHPVELQALLSRHEADSQSVDPVDRLSA